MSRSNARLVIYLASAVSALLCSAAALSAHDFWIVPNAFAVSAGASLEVRGQTSVRFPTSGSAVTPERVAEARVIGASSDDRISDLSVAGKSLLLKHRPAAAGQRVVTVALATRTSRAAPAGLKRYIGLEGAPELVVEVASRCERSPTSRSGRPSSRQTWRRRKSCDGVSGSSASAAA